MVVMSQNRSIAAAVRRLVGLDPCLRGAVERGFANLSSVARMLAPSIEPLVGSRVSQDSVLSALKRMRSPRPSLDLSVARVLAASKLSAETDLAKLIVRRTAQASDAVRELAVRSRRRFFQVLEGLSSITIVYDSKLREDVRRHFPASSVIGEYLELAALIVVSPEEIEGTPGVVASMLQQLASRGVNVEEVISCHVDTIFVVKMGDAGRAFDALSDMIYSSRALLSSGEG